MTGSNTAELMRHRHTRVRGIEVNHIMPARLACVFSVGGGLLVVLGRWGSPNRHAIPPQPDRDPAHRRARQRGKFMPITPLKPSKIVRRVRRREKPM